MRYSFTRSLAIIITAAFIWPAARIPAQDCGQSKLVSTVRKKVVREGPTYDFKLYSVATMSNYHYRIEVYDESGRIIFQSEEIRNGVRLESKSGRFRIADINSDGYADIKVLGGYSRGRAWYKVWLYDTGRQTYA